MGKQRIEKLDLDQARVFFQNLSDPSRLRIVRFLLERGEANGLQLQEAVGLAQSAISHHLGLLRAARLAATRREGHCVFYGLSNPLVEEMLRLVLGDGK